MKIEIKNKIKDINNIELLKKIIEKVLEVFEERHIWRNPDKRLVSEIEKILQEEK